MNYQQTALLLQRIESELKALECWSNETPSAEALASTAPFACDQMTLAQWLQPILREHFQPALLARFETLVYRPLDAVALKRIVALKLAKVDAKVIDEKVQNAARILNLTQYLKRTPKELSGGQRQRVAIGRAIVRSPKVFLFDEPLSNLDAALRGQTRVEIAKLHRDLGATTIYVTHDQVEAMTLADRVVVLRDGVIEQVGTPLELYDQPANQFVAQFIGTPQMNVSPLQQMPALIQQQAPAAASGGSIGLRPENVVVRQAGQGAIKGQVDLIEALGAETLIYLRTTEGAPLVARQSERTALTAGDAVTLDIATEHAHWFDNAGRVVARAAA